jgi:hypothetical protein
MNGQNYQEEKEKLTKERDMTIEEAMAENNKVIQSAEQSRNRSYRKSQTLYHNVMDPINEKLVKEMQEIDPDTDTANWLLNTESKKADLRIVRECIKTLGESRDYASNCCDDIIEAAAFKYAATVTRAHYTHDTKQLTLRDNTSKQ